MVEAYCSNFSIITAIFSGVRIFKSLTVILFVYFSLVTTILFLLPSSIDLLLRPSTKRFKLALVSITGAVMYGRNIGYFPYYTELEFQQFKELPLYAGGRGFNLMPGNILSWRLVMKQFLRPFSPFRWSKKGSCQLLVKECAGKLPRRLAQEQCG